MEAAKELATTLWVATSACAPRDRVLVLTAAPVVCSATPAKGLWAMKTVSTLLCVCQTRWMVYNRHACSKSDNTGKRRTFSKRNLSCDSRFMLTWNIRLLKSLIMHLLQLLLHWYRALATLACVLKWTLLLRWTEVTFLFLQKSCQTHTRRENGVLYISKGCKQTEACANNFIQNPRTAWSPTQVRLF